MYDGGSLVESIALLTLMWCFKHFIVFYSIPHIWHENTLHTVCLHNGSSVVKSIALWHAPLVPAFNINQAQNHHHPHCQRRLGIGIGIRIVNLFGVILYDVCRASSSFVLSSNVCMMHTRATCARSILTHKISSSTSTLPSSYNITLQRILYRIVWACNNLANNLVTAHKIVHTLVITMSLHRVSIIVSNLCSITAHNIICSITSQKSKF